MTKPTDTRRNQKPPYGEREPIVLSPQQEVALLALLSGKRHKEAADAAEVAPETLSRWLAGDSRFVAALNKRRLEIWEGHRDRLRVLAGQALATLEELLEIGTALALRLRAAALVLHAAALDIAMPAGLPTRPDAVEKAWINEYADSRVSILDMLRITD